MPLRELTDRVLSAVPLNHPMRRPVMYVPMALLLLVPVVTWNPTIVLGLLATYAVFAVGMWPPREMSEWPSRPGIPDATWANVLGEDLPPMPTAYVGDQVTLEWDEETGEIIEPPAAAQIGSGR